MDLTQWDVLMSAANEYECSLHKFSYLPSLSFKPHTAQKGDSPGQSTHLSHPPPFHTTAPNHPT